MGKRIIKTQVQVAEEKAAKQEHWQDRSLPTEYACIIYARQSTTRQTVENVESAAMQTTAQIEKAERMGWIDADKRILCIENEVASKRFGDGKLRGVSGSLRIDQRPGLSIVMEHIKNDNVKAVFAYNESRLFRDEFQIEVNTFIKACLEHDVRIITQFYTYDFVRNRYDAQQFRHQCQFAADYNAHFVKGVLLPARDRVSERGEYDGRRVAVGYIVNTDKTSPTYNRYIPYAPHAVIVRWIFKRYRELDGRLFDVGRELDAMPYVFPAFEAGIKIPKIAVEPKNGGYGIGRYGLAYMLQNSVYIGHWTFRGVTISTDNHAPIVDVDDFMYAFNRLSPVTLEGEPNPHMRELPVRYTQQGRASDALLKYVIKAPHASVYTRSSEPQQYRIGISKAELEEYGAKVKGEIGIEEIDTLFEQEMFRRLEWFRFMDDVLTENMYDQLQKIKQEKEKAFAGIAEQLQGYKAEATNIDRVLRVASDTLDDATIRNYSVRLKELRSIIVELEKVQHEADKADKDVAESQSHINEILHDWQHMSLEKKQKFISLIVESVVIDVASPRFLYIEINWKAPYEARHRGYLARSRSSRTFWNVEEETLLCQMYPCGDADEMMKFFPDKTWQALKMKAKELRIRREKQGTPSFCKSYYLSLQDYMLMQEHDIPETLETGRVEWIGWSRHMHVSNGFDGDVGEEEGEDTMAREGRDECPLPRLDDSLGEIVVRGRVDGI